MRLALMFLLAFPAFPASAQPPACATENAVPCYTLRVATSTWSLFREGWTDVVRTNWDTLHALRADGSRSMVTSQDEFHLFAVDLPPEAARRVVFLKPAGRSIRLNPRRRSAHYSAEQAPETVADEACFATAQREWGPGDFVRRRVSGTGTRLGLHVVRWTFELQESRRRMERVVEYAPGLGCTVLFSREVWRSGSAWIPERITTTEAVSLRLGEPDPALYQVPADYRLEGDIPQPQPPAQPGQTALGHPIQDWMLHPPTVEPPKGNPPLHRLDRPQYPPFLVTLPR